MKAYQALSGEAAKPRVLGLTAVLSSEPQKLLDALRPAKLHSPQNLYSSNAWQQLEPEVIEAAQTKLDERLVDQLRRVAPMLREAANEAEEIDWVGQANTCCNTMDLICNVNTLSTVVWDRRERASPDEARGSSSTHGHGQHSADP